MKKNSIFKLVIVSMLFATNVIAQVPNYAVNPTLMCYSPGNNFAQALITNTVPSATSYSWQLVGSGTCTPTYTNAATNGSIINISYPCCGVYTINCTAFAGAVPIPGALPQQTVLVQCQTFTAGFSYVQTPTGANFVNSTVNSNSTIPLNYYWDFGDNSGSNQFNPSHTYSASGIYTVTLIDSSTVAPFCNSIFSTTISVCLANFIAPTNITLGSNVTFTGVASPTTNSTFYSWSFTGGAPATVQGTNAINAITTFTSTNGLPVTFHYWSTVPYCSVSITQTLQVNSVSCNTNLIPALSYSQGANGSITFSNISTGTVSGFSTYTLQYGNGSMTTTIPSSGFSSITTQYTANGSYIATLTVGQAANCKKTSTLAVTVSNYTPTPCTISPSFTYTQGAGGYVNFINTSTGTVSGTTYTWNFGNGYTFPATSVAYNYTTNGNYVVTLNANNNFTNSSCASSSTLNVNINNGAPCGLLASFTYTQNNGVVTFSNTSTGTLTGTSYYWQFAGSTATSTLNSPTHTFAANGIYTVSINADNSINCGSWIVQTVTVNSICNINAHFTYTLGSNGLVNFNDLSTGTSSTTTYNWMFGNGATSNVRSPSHTYTSNGTYSVYLFVNNNSTGYCVDSLNLPITISNIASSPCFITSAFTHTLATNGQVHFTNLSTGTSSITTYLWNFGNGFTSTNQSPSHTYNNGGTHYVSLIAYNGNCIDTSIQAINITGINCVANSNFTLVPTNTPKFWNAIPSYPWNITSAQWSWGDGSTSSTLYTSHQYSVSANYSICLTVTVSCGATSSACANYFVYKSSEAQSDIIAVNVMQPDAVLAAISNNTIDNTEVMIFPNPSNGAFAIYLNELSENSATLSVYNLVGELIYQDKKDIVNGELSTEIDLKTSTSGIYFININSGAKTITKKIVVDK